MCAPPPNFDRMSETTVLLVRHAHTDALERWLCGRRPGISLSAAGQRQATALGRALGSVYSLSAIYSSPLARAHMTAIAIALPQSCPVSTRHDLVDIDFGEWTGRTFVELDRDPRWQAFNRTRSAASVPGGEQPAAAQARIAGALTSIVALHPRRTIAVVTHAELVRMALMRCLSMSLDAHDEIAIAPASVSAVVLGRGTARVLYVNRAFPEADRAQPQSVGEPPV